MRECPSDSDRGSWKKLGVVFGLWSTEALFGLFFERFAVFFGFSGWFSGGMLGIFGRVVFVSFSGLNAYCCGLLELFGEVGLFVFSWGICFSWKKLGVKGILFFIK